MYKQECLQIVLAHALGCLLVIPVFGATGHMAILVKNVLELRQW